VHPLARTVVRLRSVPVTLVVGHRGFGRAGHGYDIDMGILIAILVVLAIVALVLYIARRSRV
jgi:hypothetical protein